MAANPCPCGRASARGTLLAFGDCCGRYIDSGAGAAGHPGAPDAHSLMRSRYSAFVLQRRDYLLATWHASTRPESLAFEPGIRWLGLDVRRYGTTGADRAEVEFIARWRGPHGRAVRLHETSRFVREADGRWFYVDGDQHG